MTVPPGSTRRGSPVSSVSSSSAYAPPLVHRPVFKTRSVLTRAGKPKTRNGCVICKSRHVKCDEGKPSCNRCMRLGLDCSYSSGPKKVVKVRETRSLLPKEPYWVSRLSKPPAIVQIRAGAGFNDDLESRYFRLYLENSASQIGGPFKSSLWQRLIPQISEQVPFVRHAVVAIGSLRKVQSMPYDPKTSRSMQMQYVFKQYGEALRGMRDAIARGQHDMRKALISCLLVYCFEGMLGNQASAAIHASSGLALLYNLAFNKESTTPNHVKMAMESQSLEEDILEAFAALDLQVLLFIDKRTPENHQFVKGLINRNLKTWQPPMTLDDAKNSWWRIMRRNYHFSKSLRPIDIASAHDEEPGRSWEGSASMGSTDLLLSTIEDDPKSLKEEISCYLSDIIRWNALSQPLFKRIESGQNEDDQLRAAILQVQANTNYIMLSATFFKTETEYDVFLPEFTKIVELSEFVLPKVLSSAHESVSVLFHFDVGVVAALFLVGSRCRVDDLRQRAIALLFGANYREGIWDAQSVANIAKWLRSVEREDMVDPSELIPEEKRAFLTGISCDLYHKRASLQCSQRTKNGLISRDTVVTW